MCSTSKEANAAAYTAVRSATPRATSVVEIVVLAHNFASQRVASALGATRECRARNRLYFQGKAHDAIVYSLVPEDMAAWSVVT